MNARTLLMMTTSLSLAAAATACAAPLAAPEPASGVARGEQVKGVVTATGTVVASSRLRLASGEEHELVKLRNPQRGTIVVDLGTPGAYPGQAVREGDRLVVSGKAGRIDGRPVVFARYVGQLYDIGLKGRHVTQAQASAGATVGQEGVAPRADATRIPASAMLGTKVTTAKGEALGWIAGLLLDSRPRGQHYALLSVRDEAGNEKRFAYPVNAFRRGGAELLLDVPARNLDIAPGYQNRTWPSPDVRSGERYVRARDVIGHPVVDALGNRVGAMEDVVLNLRTARTEYVMVDFDDGGILPVPGHAVRISPDGAATLKPDAHRRG